MHQICLVQLLEAFEQLYYYFVGCQNAVTTFGLLLLLQLAQIHALQLYQHLRVLLAINAGEQFGKASWYQTHTVQSLKRVSFQLVRFLIFPSYDLENFVFFITNPSNHKNFALGPGKFTGTLY